MPGESPITRDDFGRLTPVAAPQDIPPPGRVWSDGDWYRIGRGHKPSDMGDRWAAYRRQGPEYESAMLEYLIDGKLLGIHRGPGYQRLARAPRYGPSGSAGHDPTPTDPGDRTALLPAAVRNAGASLRDQHVGEIAFPVAVAPRVLAALRYTGVAVLGGDFWVKADSGTYRPAYENWYADRTPEQPGEDFAARSIDRAGDEVGRRQRTAYFVTLTCTFPPEGSRGLLRRGPPEASRRLDGC